jgi:hypothetical protein
MGVDSQQGLYFPYEPQGKEGKRGENRKITLASSDF